MSKINKIFEKMNADARKLGSKLIDIEVMLDRKLRENQINQKQLSDFNERSAKIYGKLRYVHLVAHLETADVLTKQQIHEYNRF